MIRVRMNSADQQVTVPTERFLAEVERRPCLWDPTHRLFREENARKLAFRLIVDKLIENAPEDKKDEMGKCLYKKWKGIRENYFSMKKDPSMMRKYSSNRHFQLLEFLDSTIPPREKSNSSCLQSNSEYNPTPKNAITMDGLSTSSEDQQVHETNNLITRLQGSSSSNRAAKSRTTRCTSSPTNEVSSSSVNYEKDPVSGPKEKTTIDVPERKDMGEPHTTVMIDGVEFEQVTLPNGEVIVKLKEEVLEDRPSPKRINIAKKKPPIPTNFQEKILKQQTNPGELMLNKIERNVTHPQVNRLVSDSLQSDVERRDRTPPVSELKISSTTTLASTAWVPLPNDELKINSTSSLVSNSLGGITKQNDESLSPNVKSLPQTATGANKRITATKDENTLLPQGSVGDQKKSFLASSNQVFQKFTDARESLEDDINQEASIEESGSIEISDDEYPHILSPKKARVTYHKQAKEQSSANGPDRWSADQRRLGGSLLAEIPQHSNVSGELGTMQNSTATAGRLSLNFSNEIIPTLCDTMKFSGKIENQQSESKKDAVFRSCTLAGGQRSPPYLTPVRRARTNRNAEVLKKPVDKSPLAVDLNISPNLTPTKKIRTNRNTIITSDWELSSSVSDNIQQVASQLAPGNTLKTNRNTSLRISSPNDGQETQGKKVRTNRNTAIEFQEKVGTKQTSFVERGLKQSSKRIKISGNDDGLSKSIMPDSPDVDEDKSFLLSLLPEMKSMTESQNFDFRLAVMEALSRAKYSNSS